MIEAAIILYSMVTLDPTLRSPATLVAGVRAISRYPMPRMLRGLPPVVGVAGSEGAI